jgi:ParB-like nuclease family protein
MRADQQKRLTENIKADGVLTSLPLVWLMQDKKGKPTTDPETYEIISGNHRVTSAREAEFTSIDCIVVTNWISPSRRVEIQLAHNAVSGQDDLSILEELYEGLDLSSKEYSGLTDDAFTSLQNLNLSGFNVDGPTYQEIVLTFLPVDANEFTEMVNRAGKNAKALYLAADLQDFDDMFDAIVRTKEQHNIQNNAVAIGTLAQLAMERLDQLEAEADEGADEEGADVVE